MNFMARKFITYFDKEGENYTDELIEAVKDKLEVATDIKRVLIASSTGESALKLYDAIGDDVENNQRYPSYGIQRSK